LTVSRSRYLGVVVTATLLVAGLLWWRSSSPGNGLGSGARVVPRRGGQLVASLRTDPRSFNRYVARDFTTDVVTLLTQDRLVRVNRSTFELEPRLAERWESSADGRMHTVHLRRGLAWSDGTPFTAADVIFSFDAAFDGRTESILASSLMVGGQRIRATSPDADTVVISFAGPSGPGIRLLDNLPILPRHKLQPALAAGTFAKVWDTRTPPADLVGMGAFVLREYQPGQRLVLDRNARYWRHADDGTALPYLDRLVLEIVPDQNAELLRLQARAIDMTQDALRPEDFVAARRAEQQGALTMVELGVALDADAFWFSLKPDAKKADPRFAFVQKRQFRQAISHAVDREEFAQTVFLGEAVPVWGPITPGNRQWFDPNVPRYPPDADKARALLKEIGLEDRNGNGVVEDAMGTEARFAVITQRGVSAYERGTTVLRERAAGIGIALDIVPLEFGAMIQKMLASDYEAIYMKPIATDLDPAGNMDFWLSSGSAHIWNLEQKTPATEWEKRIDTLMLEQAASTDDRRRHELFNDVQRILAENVPVLYFAAPRTYSAHSTRSINVTPSVLRPPFLWNADLMAVTGDTNQPRASGP
jgi:peptide/nickel transport system substrate-binding protein